MLTIQNQGLAAVTMPVGVYLIAGGKYSPNETEVLLTGTTHWQKGPTPPPMDTAPCAVAISQTSFISVFNREIIEFDTSVAGPFSEVGWRDSSIFSKLKWARGLPACARLDSKVIIAGGAWSNDRDTEETPTIYRSTEILNPVSKTLIIGGDMNQPRVFFHILNLNNKLLAIGGFGSNSTTSMEEWDPSTSTWSMLNYRFSEHKVHYGALVVSKDLVCPA